MDPITQQTLLGAAGAGGAGEYVDDVFSTDLWAGNGSARNITSGLDMSGEGGLVWIKSRTNTLVHVLTDTERGYNKQLCTNIPDGQYTDTNQLSAFNSNGFSLGTTNSVNQSSNNFVSWSFRKAPGFFDVVTYTGNESNPRQIAHNLGSVPGMIIVKSLSTSNWYVYHRSLNNGSNPGNYRLRLDTTNGTESGTSTFGATATSTHFTISTNCNYANNYVAYVFAHDDASFGTGGNESIIKCGSYTSTSGSNPNEVNLGFEPQWVMIKNTGSSSAYAPWIMFDNMRGVNAGDTSSSSYGHDPALSANYSDSEGSTYNYAANFIDFTPTGFKTFPSNTPTNVDTGNFIYMAIRRPNKPPTAATEVFAVATGNSSNPIPAFVSNFTVDAAFLFNFNGGYDNYLLSRLTGDAYLRTNTTSKQTTNTGETFDSNTGWARIYNSTYQSVMFKRAPGFMDVVAWVGDGTSVKNVSHNLEAVPEMVISKMRLYSTSSSYGGDRWYVYHKDVNGVLGLNSNGGIVSSTGIFNSAPTATNLPFDDPSYDSLAVNGSGITYVAYLFATLPGISKVGSFSGTGSAINVDCGFTNGARFILIKRINGTGDWYLWDSLRGIVSGNDPYLLLNVNTTQTTNTDYIDPLSTGFTVTSSAPAALNTSGGTYLFLAIA